MARLAVNPYRPLPSVNGSFIWTHSEIFIAQQQLNKQTKFQLLFSSVLDPNHILTFLLAHENSLLCANRKVTNKKSAKEATCPCLR